MIIVAMEERYLNTNFNHYCCEVAPPNQRRAAANIYQKCIFFHDRPSAARHIVMIICGNGNVPALGAFHFVFVGFDLGRFSAVSLAG